jgi:hypothetical protein
MHDVMRITKSGLVAFAFSLALAGCCGGETGATSTASAEPEPMKVAASCDAIEGMSVCMDYETKVAASSGCPSFEGKVKDGACPAEGRVVACKQKDGSVRNYYKTGGSPHELAYAQKHCKNAMGGTEIKP